MNASIPIFQLSSPIDLRSYFAKELVLDKPILIQCYWHKDNSPSLAIYSSHAYCFGKCKQPYSMEAILEKLGDKGASLPPPSSIKIKKYSLLDEASLWKTVKQFHKNLWELGKQEYFLKRGITNESIKSFLLGYTGIAFAIPLIMQNKLLTIRYRRDDEKNKKGHKYWGTKGHNSQLLWRPREKGNKVIWSEGELDTLLLCQEGYDALTFINGISSQHTSSFSCNGECSTVQSITLAFDQDAASYQKSLSVAKELKEMNKQVKIARWPHKDINDLFLAKEKRGLIQYLGEN